MNRNSFDRCLYLFAFFSSTFGNAAVHCTVVHENYLDPSTENSNSSMTVREKIEEKMNCKTIVYDANSTDDIFLLIGNATLDESPFIIDNFTAYVCASAIAKLANVTLDCRYKFCFFSNEFEILPNLSALIGNQTVEFGSYEINRTELYTCYEEEGDVFTYISKIGSCISIVALTLQLVIFCFVPSLRNLSGYNLAALSLALLLGYSFLLIGQIPEILGTACVVSGVLQQYFFLVAFFCMNVMAFDVWRMIKMSVNNLSTHTPKNQFVWYSLYTWGCPTLITGITVGVDNVEGVPSELKPNFGWYDICWITNDWAKTTFFVAPVFLLLFCNTIFFTWTARIFRANRMKTVSDQQKKMRDNFLLFVKLAVMMGFTWLVGVIGLILDRDIVWLIHDILNSLQGLCLFLISVLSTKVKKHIAEKTSTKKTTSSEKQTSVSKSEQHSA